MIVFPQGYAICIIDEELFAFFSLLVYFNFYNILLYISCCAYFLGESVIFFSTSILISKRLYDEMCVSCGKLKEG